MTIRYLKCMFTSKVHAWFQHQAPIPVLARKYKPRVSLVSASSLDEVPSDHDAGISFQMASPGTASLDTWVSYSCNT